MKQQTENSLTATLQQLSDTFLKQVAAETKLDSLENLYRDYFGKNGKFHRSLSLIQNLSSVEEKRSIGKLAHQLMNECKKVHETQRQKTQYKEEAQFLEQGFFDIQRPVDLLWQTGSLHPITQVQKRVEEIFSNFGFQIVDGPELENEEMNFSRLNFSDDHPARDMQDTIWADHFDWLMRTHTSAVQSRILQQLQPPLRLIAPGRCYRFEETDTSHEHTFHQVEGMMIDVDLSVVDLICIMEQFLYEFFQKKIEVRLRPGYFPFVEPGFELDISCLICQGKGCSTCKKSGWLELLPCGMVHPNVLKAGKINPDLYSGFAFGLGLDRLTMMLYGIEDIRYFMIANLRFLKQF